MDFFPCVFEYFNPSRRKYKYLYKDKIGEVFSLVIIDIQPSV
jgi:hypothetical protein